MLVDSEGGGRREKSGRKECNKGKIVKMRGMVEDCKRRKRRGEREAKEDKDERGE